MDVAKAIASLSLDSSDTSRNGSILTPATSESVTVSPTSVSTGHTFTQQPPLGEKLRITQTLILSQHFERIEAKSRGVRGINLFRLDPGMDKNGNNCTYVFIPQDTDPSTGHYTDPWSTLADECPYFNNLLAVYDENKHAMVCLRLVLNEEDDAQKILLCELDTKNEVAVNRSP